MDDVPQSVDRAVVAYDEDRGSLRCSNCNGDVTDADAECPTCESPLDWGASASALTKMASTGR